MRKENWKQFLKEYKRVNFPTAPASPEQYFKNSEELLLDDLHKDIIPRGIKIKFGDYGDEASILNLEKDNKLPQLYEWKFEAYKLYGLELGYIVYVDISPDFREVHIHASRID